MCKAGNVIEAYKTAKKDLSTLPQNVWAQRGMGWALYYMLKMDIEQENESASFVEHIEEFVNLDLLTMAQDSLIFENVLWKLAEFIKTLSENSVSEMDKLFSLFSKYTFSPSKGYSYLLKSCLHFKEWEHIIDFLEWWNLDNLLPDDFQDFKLENGRKIMSLAERAYIAYSKALLRQRDKDKISAFLPRIEALIENYPDMTYPGYFYGKLMLAIGNAREDDLNIVMPFVRKKKTEFWIWQLLSEFYNDDLNICLACLLRAVHCKTQETFLGKVRIKLASIYLACKDFPRAKYHIEKIVQCNKAQGWNLPYEVQNWLRESWMSNTAIDDSENINYKQITDEILSRGSNESIAVVTYVDSNSKRAFLVYGEEKLVAIKIRELNTKILEGSLLKINWLPAQNGKINIINSTLVNSKTFEGNTYIKRINGIICKPLNKQFAFIEGQGIKCFIPPLFVQRYHINGGEAATVMAVYNFNKKRNEWSWTCVSIDKM